MKSVVLIIFTAFTAALLMAGQAMGVELDKYRSTPSPPPEGVQTGDTDFQPLNRSQVQEIQRILTQKGFDPGEVDGYIGTETREAISEFQRSEDLAVTGNPNEETLRALVPPEDHEFFGLAPEFEGETEQGGMEERLGPDEGTGSMKGY